MTSINSKLRNPWFNSFSEWLLFLIPISAAIGPGLRYANVYFFHIVTLVYVVLFMAHSLAQGRISPTSGTNLHYIFYAMLIWYALSGLWAIKPVYTLQYSVYVLLGFLIVWATITYSSSLDRVMRLLAALVAVFGLEVVISLFEIAGIGHWPTSALSPYSGLFGLGDLKTSSILNGFGHNQNYVAITMGIILPFLLLCYKSAWRYLLAFGCLFVIIAASSRATLIGMTVMFLSYILVVPIRKIPLWAAIISVFTAWMVAGSLGAGALPQQVYGIKDEVLQYVQGEADGNKGSVNKRTYLIARGMHAFVETGGLGVGAGGSLALPEYYGAEKGTKASMHNFWIEILVDGGIVLFFAFICWYLYVLYKLWFISHYSKNPRLRKLSAAGFLSMMGFIFSAISASSTIYFLPMWILFGISISIAKFYGKPQV